MRAGALWPSRRSLLASLGGTAAVLASPFPRSQVAEAAAAGTKRLVVLYSGNGTIRDNWLPTGTTEDFTLGPILDPLAPFQSVLTVVDGVQIYAGGAGGNPHHLGFGCGLTAVDLVDGQYLDNEGNYYGSHGGPTVDQVIADAIAPPTPYHTLELGVQAGVLYANTSMSKLAARGPTQLLPPEIDPYKVFDRVFGGSLTPEELAKVRADQASVLDFAYRDLARITPKLSSEEQLRLGLHMESVRTVETRLQTVGPECDPPDPGAPLDVWANDNFPVLAGLQLELLAAALACDQTRIATFMFSESGSQTVYRWVEPEPGYHPEAGHHDISHQGDSDEVAQSELTAMNRWIAEQVAALATSLQAVPDGAGTLLDGTMLLWVNDMGTGNTHDLANTPYVIVGNAHGAIPGGRFHTFEGRYQTDLLLAVCQAMGVDIDVFGNPEVNAGPLPL